MHLLVLTQLFSTLSLFGLIWFVQVVHYPLFAAIGEPQFRAYTAAHATRTTWVVAPLMLLELGSAGLLLLPALRPAVVQLSEAWLGLMLLAAIWLSTALVQVPLHNRLQAGYSLAHAGHLVRTNWLRTVAWTLRAVLVLTWVARRLPR